MATPLFPSRNEPGAILRLACAALVFAGFADAAGVVYRDGAVLVGFKSGMPPAQAGSALAAAGARELRVIGAGVHVLQVLSGHEAEAIARLQAHPAVRYAEPDFLQSVAAGAAPNDTYVGSQWAIPKIAEPAAWSVTTGGTSVVVAVLDTGIQYSHPDLLTNIWNNPGINGCPAGTHGYNVLAANCDPMDDDTSYGGHGSHVSGILGAAGNNAAGVAGVNWTASIMAVKWVSSGGTGFTSDLIAGMDWVIKAKQAGVNVRVANDSATWPGTASSQALQDEIDLLGTNDILLVTAAGNTAQNNDTTPRYPCSYNRPNMLCVAASDQNDNLWSSSNYGTTTVQLAAPGVNIYSTERLSNYGNISGGSMAAPQVAGTAALILSLGYRSVSDLRTRILNGVDVLPSLTNYVATGGRLNVCKSVPGCTATQTQPVTLQMPGVTGAPRYGSVLGAWTGVWSGAPSAYSYQWFRCSAAGANCAAIPGAASQAYALLAPADSGAAFAVAVTASNASGSAQAQSAASAPAASAASAFALNATIADAATLTGGVKWQITPASTVNFVQFYVDGLLSQTASASPYVYNGATTGLLDTTTLSNGPHLLGARALAADNRTYVFYGAAVTVSNQTVTPVSITTSSLPGGQQNVAYSTTLAATGGATPYTWSVTAGALPAGLSLASATGVISGAPSTAGISNFTVQVKDAGLQTASKALSITITAVVGGGISLVQSNSAEQANVTSVSAAFPTANTSGNLIVAFVRMSTSAQTVTVRDSAGNSYTDAVSHVQTSDGHQVHLFYAKNIAGGANTVTATFSGTNGHPWLAICEYSGLSATNPLDRTAHSQGSGTAVNSGATATTSGANELVFAGAGFPATAFSGSVTAGAGYTLGQQDTGSSRAATETMIVSAAGSYSGTFTLTTSTNWSAVVATFSATGGTQPVSITTTSLPGGQQNVAYSATLAATGGTAPYTWSITAGSLPAGLGLAAATGVVSGTPTTAGAANFTVQVTDAGSQTASRALSITIAAAAAVSITTTSLPGGRQNVAYSATLAATGGTTPYTWSITAGSLPAGLGLVAATGVVSGTPTTAGAANFTVQVTDAGSQTASKALSITIASAGGGISLLQSNAAEGSAVPSLPVAFPAPNTAGNLVIAFVRMSGATQTVSVADSAGNVYTDAVSQVQTSDGHQIHIFYARNVAGGTNTVTATFSATNNHPWLAVYEFSGLSTTNPLDQTAHAQGSGSAANSGATAATASPNELVFAGAGFPAAAFTGTVTAGTAYTLGLQDAGTSRAATEAQVVSATGSYSGTFTLSASTNWSAAVAAFRP